MAPFVREILELNDLVGGHYAEPYAGGAGVALDLLLGGHVSQVHLNDSSLHVYAIWTSIITRAEDFCSRIRKASLTVDDWRRHREIVRHPENHDLFSLGFSTFYLNRCNRSGILTAGVIGGLAQAGKWRIDARFPRNELIRRVEAIATKADRICVTNLDAEEFMRRHVPSHLPNQQSLIYCDPPYYERSQRLYLNGYQRADHERLAAFIQTQLAHHWIVSYDAHEDVMELYEGRKRFVYNLPYSATNSYEGREIFIFSDTLSVPLASRVRTVNAGLRALA